MIPFDISKFTNRHVKLKHVTSALGGSISIVDEEATAKSGKETFKRIPVPLAVTRNFIAQHEISRYIQPVITSVTMYDGIVVALERHPLGNMGEESNINLFGDDVAWKSVSEINITKNIDEMTNDGADWYIDGTLIYKIANDNSTILSADKKFKSVPVVTIKLADISSNNLQMNSGACISFTTNNGVDYISPPIWKSLDSIGNRQLNKIDDDSIADDYQFDKIDQFLSVNLNFALFASNELSDVFGYDIIEPFALDDIMVQLQTVNLPKVSKHIKNTFDIGMPFTHAIAWLVGLSHQTKTLQSYKVIRATLKYLTSKGVYPKKVLQHKSIFHDGHTINDVPLLTLDEALHSTTRTRSLTQDNKDVNVSVVGSLYVTD